MAVRKRMRTIATTPGSVVIIVKPGNVKQTLEGAAMGTNAMGNEENETHSDDDLVLEEGTRGKALRPEWQRHMRCVLDHMTDCPEGRKTSSFLDTSSVQPANAAEVLDIWSSRWEVLQRKGHPWSEAGTRRDRNLSPQVPASLVQYDGTPTWSLATQCHDHLAQKSRRPCPRGVLLPVDALDVAGAYISECPASCTAASRMLGDDSPEAGETLSLLGQSDVVDNTALERETW